MINALMEFRRSMLLWGRELEPGYHNRLIQNPEAKKAVPLLVLFAPESEIQVRNFPDFQKMYYVSYSGANQSTALSFKFHDGSNEPGIRQRLMSKIARTIQRHEELAEQIGNQPSLDVLHTLFNRFSTAGAGQFYDAIVRHFGNEKEMLDHAIYISVDLSDNEVIQRLPFFGLVSEGLINSVQPSDATDVFGHPAGGAGQKGWKVTLPKIGTLYLCAKNDDNECYARYGLNSVEACPVGEVSRNMISNLLTRVVSKSNEGRLWYMASRNDRGKNFVLTSLYPSGSVFEMADPAIEPADWDVQVVDIIKALTKQQMMSPDAHGVVYIFHNPNKGAVQTLAGYLYRLDYICSKLKEWYDGGKSGVRHFRNRKCFRPTIWGLYYDINKRWTFSLGKFSYNWKETITLPMAYEFFFGQESAVEFIAHHYAKVVVPMLLPPREPKGSYPPEVLSLLPIANLILHKRGYRMNSDSDGFTDNWAFLLGRIFSVGNWVHKEYFEGRGQRLPPVLLGQLYIRAAFSSPKSALPRFMQHIQPSADWLAQPENMAQLRFAKPLFTFRKLHTQLKKSLATCGGVPSIPSEDDRIMLGIGYHFIPPKRAENTDDSEADDSEADNPSSDEITV